MPLPLGKGSHGGATLNILGLAALVLQIVGRRSPVSMLINDFVAEWHRDNRWILDQFELLANGNICRVEDYDHRGNPDAQSSRRAESVIFHPAVEILWKDE